MIFTKLDCFGYGFAAGVLFCAIWLNIAVIRKLKQMTEKQSK